MNKDDITNIISNLDEDLIKSAEKKRAFALDSFDGGSETKKRRIIKQTVMAVMAVAACAALTVGGISWLRAVNSSPDVVRNDSEPSPVTAPIPVTEGDTDTGTLADSTTAAPPAVTGGNAVTTVPEESVSAQKPSDTGLCSVPKKPDETTASKPAETTPKVTTTEKPSTQKTEKTTEKTENINEPAPVEAPESPVKVRTVSAAQYPKLAKYPYFSSSSDEEYQAWKEDNMERYEARKSLDDSPMSFYKASTRELLQDSQGKNLVYSPVNVYMALSMLAETTDGDSREQILRLLDTDSIEALRLNSANMWRANYLGDGTTTSVLANSIWLSDRVDFTESTLKTIAESYKASSYSGTMGSDDMNYALRDWLNEQTGGLLEGYVGGVELPREAVMAIASTVYFKARWDYDVGFSEITNETRVFYSPLGELEREFMYTRFDPQPYYYSDDYGAVELPFAYGSSMWFILPDEGKTPDDLLESGEFLEMIHSPGDCNSRLYKLHCRIPKFDISSELKLDESLKALGVTDVFDPDDSDFSPLTSLSKGIALGEVSHCARVAIDEEGCEAAAFTVFGPTMGFYKPPEYSEFEFTVDRPFIFVIDNGSKQPLFVGVVNEP